MASIFREKSMERVSSPEQLNDYIKVTNPGIWLTLAAIIVLLAGFIVWGIVGKLETKVNTVVVSDTEKTVCYIKEADIAKIEAGDTVRIGEKEYAVKAVPSEPVSADGSFSEYAMHIGNFTAGEWVYAVELDTALQNGVYEASVITDSVSPISFLFE